MIALLATTGRRTMDRAASKLAVLVLTSLALAALLAGCATNPVTGRREISLVSTGQEEQMGREGYSAVLAEYGAYDDPKIQAYVDQLGQKLGKVSHLPNLTWHFTVIDDPTVNAFAMPGGYIYVTRGILAHLNSEAQLAGVLGHEIGHVTHRHSAEQITRQQFAGLGLGVASMLSPALARYSNVAQQALGLMFLSFSRTHETEADQLGVEYSTAANYDSREMPSTYAMLQRVGERAGSRLPAFLNTHPDPGDRLQRTGELSRAATAGKTGLIVRHAEYIQRLDGMVYGADPRQGYFEGDVFYHPQLRFVLTLPSGWAHENGHTAVTAAAPQQRAMMQLTLSTGNGLSPSAFVSRLQQDGKITGAQGGSESIGGYPAWAGSVTVADANGQAQVLAAAFIRRSPDQFFQVLGRSAQAGDADFNAILDSARSFRSLTDPSRLSPEPARVHVTRAPGGTTFASAIGTGGVDPEEVAILNNRTLEDRLPAGELVKTVTPSRLR